eukprot:SAG11_NODE_18098_length_500_cov_0.625935_1_plen_159_part_10
MDPIKTYLPKHSAALPETQEVKDQDQKRAKHASHDTRNFSSDESKRSSTPNKRSGEDPRRANAFRRNRAALLAQSSRGHAGNKDVTHRGRTHSSEHAGGLLRVVRSQDGSDGLGTAEGTSGIRRAKSNFDADDRARCSVPSNLSGHEGTDIETLSVILR